MNSHSFRNLGAIIFGLKLRRVSITTFSCIVLLASSSPPAPTMKFCELMQYPDKYNGKLVKVRATWVYGFEWSYLHCLGCEGRVWLDTSGLDERSERTAKHTPKAAAIVNIDVEGIFQSGGGFGHERLQVLVESAHDC